MNLRDNSLLEHVNVGWKRQVSAALETGIGRSLPNAISWPYKQLRLASLNRSIVCPKGSFLLPFQGATLGGSWKTPLALETAIRLSTMLRNESLEVPVWFLAHGVGGRSPKGMQTVGVNDPISVVGDESVQAARALHSHGIKVAVVARKHRERWLESLTKPSVVVADSWTGTAHDPRVVTVLCVDAEQPWGAGYCPPRGDLRAPAPALVSGRNLVLAAAHTGGSCSDQLPPGSEIVRYELLVPEELVGERVWSVSAHARPERWLAALHKQGVRVVKHISFADHGGQGVRSWLQQAWPEAQREGITRVVVSEKTAVWLVGGDDDKQGCLWRKHLKISVISCAWIGSWSWLGGLLGCIQQELR
jgi:tetraacyldisaccharide 4'-kinase